MQMIRESRNPEYLALLQQNPAPPSAPSEVSPETDQSSSSSQASASAKTSWCRHFFSLKSVDGNEVQTCLLPLDDGATSNHTATVSNNIVAMKRHIADSQFHQKAHQKYIELKVSGRSDEVAAKETIAWAQSNLKRHQISFPRDNTPDKELESEIALVCLVAQKGLSFSAISNESEYFSEYHALKSVTSPPSRKRLSTSLLRTVYHLVQKKHEELLAHADFFSITTDSATVYNQRFVSLTVHFVS
jgi:hypothetical protein